MCLLSWESRWPDRPDGPKVLERIESCRGFDIPFVPSEECTEDEAQDRRRGIDVDHAAWLDC